MKKIALLLTLAACAFAADLPRPAPDLSIALPGGKAAKPSDYRGKVVVLTFFLTTCPHCQKAITYLAGIQKDLGPQGLQVLAGAMDEGANVPQFTQTYHPGFPVGTVDYVSAGAYMQLSPTIRTFVPFMVFIDRKGVIQAQYTGGDDFLKDEATEDQNIRGEVQKLLGPGKTAGKRTKSTPVAGKPLK